MAGQVFGLDFGTTNSLLTVIGRDNLPTHLLDEKGRPHPSVVWYRGSDIIVGRKARENLDAGADAVTGSFVRSPKRLLTQDSPIHVGGRELDPRDVVAQVLRFLRNDAADDQAVSHEVNRAVMTIPVKLDGAGRRRLREAARKAEISVVQFVHEPLAALYAYLRSHADYRRRLAELDGRRILVFDWGGGTLDLTLCQVQGDQIFQLANMGNNDVGGDRFDEIIRNQVRDKHASQHGIGDLPTLEREETKVLLLNQCELRKIELSQREDSTVFVRNYLREDGPGRDLSVSISRAELSDWVRELVDQGLKVIDLLLEQNRLLYSQIELCLPTGGMVNMPAVRAGLTERFGARAPRLANGDRIISEGAAWIAHDDLRLGLAKPIELLQSDDTYAAVVPVPLELPRENLNIPAADAVYHCVDPRSGSATFTFARPNRPRVLDAKSDRQSYATFHLDVDKDADPLLERLELTIGIDHDYIAHIDLRSTMCNDHVKAELFDLEFTLQFPSTTPGHGENFNGKRKAGDSSESLVSTASLGSVGQIRIRSNISLEYSWKKVPGDLIERYRPNWFDDRGQEYSDWQKKERVYYKDCPFCHRTRYEFRKQGCTTPTCLWLKAHPSQFQDFPLHR